jgi:signal transduction histidine kinase
MARTATEKDPTKAAQALADVRSLIEQALDNLRDLARGIYPPVLAQKGLVPALRAQALPAGLKATVTSKCDDRFDPAIEAAVYFCCLEAIQNAAKHGATRAKISLGFNDGVLSFSVVDDGPGFDTATAKRGSGLQNMEDRVATVGGHVEIHSEAGRGTTISGAVPARSKEQIA